MSNVTEVIKALDLDLTNVPDEQKGEVKRRVSNYLLNEMLLDIGSGKSPVKGESWKALKKDYAEEVHGGRRTPILEVEGDMLNALRAKPIEGDKVEVGIRGSQAPKADGHNQISNEAKQWAAETNRTQYKRRFIPDANQKFTGKYDRGIERIVGQYRVDTESFFDEDAIDELRAIGRAEETTAPAIPDEVIRDSVRVEQSDFFSDDVIEQLLIDAAIRRRNGS